MYVGAANWQEPSSSDQVMPAIQNPPLLLLLLLLPRPIVHSC